MDKRICFVTTEFDGLDVNGGLGSYHDEMARLLSRYGWEVTVLYYADDGRDIGEFAGRYLRSYGVSIYEANRLCREVAGISPEKVWQNFDPYLRKSHVIHEALQALTGAAGLTFDLIEFHDWQNPGFVPVSMKKNFHMYGGSKLIVKLHGPSQWIPEAAGRIDYDIPEMKRYFMECYSFENADIQASQSYHLLAWAGEHAWKVRPDAGVCRTPCSISFEDGEGCRTTKDEVVFFGRLEGRKGIEDFTEALKLIGSLSPGFFSSYRITFLGKADLWREYVDEAIKGFNLQGFDHKFLTLSRRESIYYLRNGARLAIMPSRMDNLPNVVTECMFAGIPFLTTRSGGTPEILGDIGDIGDAILCKPSDPTDLAKHILARLRLDADAERRIARACLERIRDFTSAEKIVRWYEDRLPAGGPEARAVTGELPGVTILVPTHNTNTARYLDTTLRSLLSQTYKDIRVIVNDSSDEPEATAAFERLKTKYPGIVFLRGPKDGIGSALNRMLPLVTTRYVMEVDGDNIARPDMVERLVECMENQPQIAAMSSYLGIFKDPDESSILSIIGLSNYYASDRCAYLSFLGPCLPLLFFENVQGDANSIFRTEAVRAVGGWPEEKRRGVQDWSMWINLLASGYELDVVRLPLYYYRDHPAGLSKSTRGFDIDTFNMGYVRRLIEKRPVFFFTNCYGGLHGLIRCFEYYRMHYRMRADRDAREIEGLKRQLGADAGELEELRQLKSRALYALGKKLGALAGRSRGIKKALEVSGTGIKKILGKS